MGYSKLVRQKQLRKALLLVLLSVNDYVRVYTSLFFIITNFHTELKSHVAAEPLSEILPAGGHAPTPWSGAPSPVKNHWCIAGVSKLFCQRDTYVMLIVSK